MSGIPITFKLERESTMPILTVTGISPIPGVERFMLAICVEMIEEAAKFKGKVMLLKNIEDMTEFPKGLIAVRFYLIFKSEHRLEAFMRGMGR